MFSKHAMKRAMTGALVATAASFPASAQAMIPPPGAPAGADATAIETLTPQAQPSVNDGFHWGDAGIGAAGMVLLVGAGTVASGAARRRRLSRTVAG